MEQHVAGYADEWRGVLEDTEKLSRFVSFVNAPDAADPTITFVRERGQPVPAPRRGASVPQPIALGLPGVGT